MDKLQWNDVVGQKNLVGGYVESRESHSVNRGLIEKIELEGNMFVITLAWCARLQWDGGWKKLNEKRFSADVTLATLYRGDNGAVCYSQAYLGSFTLFPKDSLEFGPEDVVGL